MKWSDSFGIGRERWSGMTGTRTSGPETVRFDSLDAMPPVEPLSSACKAPSDEGVARRAAADPDAGVIPAGFWETVPPLAFTATKKR